MNHRKLTPSMSLLLAFEAAARHESFTRAAEELALTQSAVSRQVQALEAMLDVALFVREGKRIAPTDAGRAYMAELGDALARIRDATLRVLASTAPATQLRVATLPTFGAKWLMPRLPRFYQAHPSWQIDLHSRIGPVDFAARDLDAAIAVGDGRWPELIAHRLHDEELVLVGSPAALPAAWQARGGRAKRRAAPSAEWLAAQLAQLALLRVRSFPDAGRVWCEAQGVPHDALRPGPSFELTSHLIQAVIAGIGVALVPRMLVEEELRDGRLVSPFAPVPSSRAYFLVYPPRVAQHTVLVAFRDWLLADLGRQQGDAPSRHKEPR
ncbi:LysR substrate-binding domain-containing protein [Burkholderia sp. Ac-20379]|uniref:LysR substrate-binding domain-containing protein n=1 Tax=Burkholderia sp. Ac-20379 TaxID=2703900 RepID=UPI00197EE47D|nr:LysR substrate-binding domain-containing protein [Burkholderia sp. Ac-20379]MBN3726674.1 LysR family transcriptional regulator [Burkholderia sp. Ac-20379]